MKDFWNKFCSRTCSEKGRIYKRGSEHGNWTGGRSTLRQQVSNTSEYVVWRQSVFERDDYTCQDCGERGGYKEADHIKSFVEIVREYNIKTIEDALACQILWEVSNGRTLCRKCHIKTFKYYGNQFTANRKNGVNSRKPRTGNLEPSQEIANRLLEGVETRLNKYNTTSAPPKGKK